MEQGILPQSTNLGTQFDSCTNFDYIDELMLEDCWLLDANGSEFSHIDTSTFEPSIFLPNLEANHDELDVIRSKNSQEERQISQSQETIPSESYLLDWITPRAPTSVIDRLIYALGYMKDCSRDKNVLIQVWVPVKIGGGKCVLTTNGQPFSVDLNCQKLARYREISANYQFPAEEDSKEVMGLPGRVFRNKAPEWTPDVRFFTRDEYPRVSYAQQYDVRGTLAVPVLERGTRNCLGVVEVVLTTQKIKYRPELESVCKALEAVDLGSSQLSSSQNLKTCDFSYQAALPEISSVLRTACQTHGLPLAQTWVSCIVQGKQGCRHSEESCYSTVDSACYVNDPGNILGFHEACSEHHLLKDQGIVGRAFGTNQPCFLHDVTSCSKTEYPLSHHARMFGLKAAVAIRLRSICTGSVDFVLEFFLPINCTNPKEQKGILDSLSTIIRNNCWTLRVVTDKELQEESREVLFNSYSREGITFATDPSTSGYETNKTGEKRRTKAEETITLQVLRQHFAGSLKDAAKSLGVCPTTLKRICRREGIDSWPSRKIKKVNHSLEKIQRVIDSVQGTSGISKIESFYSNFPEMSTPQILNPKLNDHVKPLNEPGILSPPSSSGSQSSTLSQCFSSGTQPNSLTDVENREDPPMVKEECVKSVTELAMSNEMELGPSGGISRERDGPRIKVSFGEDNIRLRMQSTWRYEDLLEEITRRFGINDASGFYLKYLDDDEEWVLLTCDADLEECIDVCGSSKSDTIKLSFLRDPQSQFGTSFDVIRDHLEL